MQNYEHHIFVSYRRSDELWVRWTRDIFVRALKTFLQPGLGPVEIYIDESIETGASWPLHLAKNLSRSRLMVAILSRHYFQSEWCRLELALMHDRELKNGMRTPENPFGLIIPVVIDDGTSFPPEVQAMQSEQLHAFANPLIHKDSPKQEALGEVLRERLCPMIERALTRVPDFDPSWENMTHQHFANRFQIQTQTQRTVPSLILPQL